MKCYNVATESTYRQRNAESMMQIFLFTNLVKTTPHYRKLFAFTQIQKINMVRMKQITLFLNTYHDTFVELRFESIWIKRGHDKIKSCEDTVIIFFY